jgi:PAS domain S-box-containing protein
MLPALQSARLRYYRRTGARLGFLGAPFTSLRRNGARREKLPGVFERGTLSQPFSVIADAGKDLVLMLLDASGCVTSWSATAERIKGYKAEEVLGRHFSCFFTAAAIAAGQPAETLAQATSNGVYEQIGQRVRRDGSIFWAASVVSAIRDQSGRLMGFAKVVRDLTGHTGHTGVDVASRLPRPDEAPGQQRSEEPRRLEDPASLLSTIVEASEAAIVTSDPELRFTSWNGAAERIFGYTAQEAIGQPIEFVTPSHLYPELKKLKERLRHGEPIRDLETLSLRKDGSVIHVLLTAIAIIDAGATMLGVSLIARDISAERAARGRLRETEEWLRLTLAHAPLMVTATDRNGVYTMVEGQALSALGVTMNEALLGRSALEDLSEGSPTAETTRKALTGETTTSMAVFNGHSFDVWKAPLRDARGRITGTIGVSTDVSRRVAIEQELKVRLRQQEAIAGISKSALGGAPFEDLAQRTAEWARQALDVDLAGVFLRDDSDASFKAQGLAAAPASGPEPVEWRYPPTGSLAAYAVSTGSAVISEELKHEIRFQPHPEVMRLGIASSIAIAFGPFNGNWGVVTVYSREPQRFTDDDAHFIEAIANILTIAVANLEGQQKLLRSESYFRQLIENTSDVLVVVDRDGIMRFVGGSFELIFGYPAEKIVGTPSIGLLAPETRPAVIEATRRALRNPGEVLRVEYRQQRADHSWLDCEAVMKAVTGLGEDTMIVVSMRDISARKHHEAAIAHARDVALEGVRLKSAFLANMSHEIRTPVNIIIGYSDLVAEYLTERGDGSQNEFLRAITRAGRRLLRTIDGVLDYSKLSSGTLETEPQRIVLGSLIERQLELVEADATIKKLTITYENEASDAEVWFDEYCLGHALLNLLENGIKFTNQGGLRVRVYRESSGALCIDVGDTGIGIDPAFLPRLLEPFAQEEMGFTRRFEGNGLGLAVAKGYLERNGARLTANSAKGVGSVFTVTFPRVIDCGRNPEPHSADYQDDCDPEGN